MSQHQHGKHIIPRSAKYPMFFFGLLIIIAGGLAVPHLGMSETVEVATVVAGFILMFLGIVLE
ncbi:MAG: hypothetical protein ACREBS_11340 [Nitrososphaerales archaeon]